MFAWVVLHVPEFEFKSWQGKAKETRLKTMEAAIEAATEGQSVRIAAKAFGIPYSTLQDMFLVRIH